MSPADKQRELLAEALEALDGIAAEDLAADAPDDFHVVTQTVRIRDFRRARAAADKIRAALTQEKQT